MPLIECKDCGAKVSDAAPACIQCGCPIVKAVPRSELLAELGTELQKIAQPPAPTPARRTNEFICRNCHSDDVKLLPLVHSQGTANITTKTDTVGVGYGALGLGVGGASSLTSGTQQTDLARMVAPPKPTKADQTAASIGCMGVIVVGYFLTTGFGFWGLVVSGIAGIIQIAIMSNTAEVAVKERDKTTYIPQHVKWQRSFLCMRCMRVTDPGEA